MQYKTKPRTKSEIRRTVEFFKETIGLKKNEPFNAVKFLDEYLSGLNDGQYTFEIVEDSELRTNLAETNIGEKTIKIRQSVYDKAYLGDEEAIKTIKHEYGHWLMHRDVIPILPKQAIKLRDTEDPEWQADVFAEYL